MKIVIVYRSYSNDPKTSHGGLSICAINTSKTLNQNHIPAEIFGAISSEGVHSFLLSDPEVTHVVIQAPWIESHLLLSLARRHPRVQFAVNCHSNVGFLQTEPGAVTKMLDLLELEQVTSNLHCAGNSQDFTDWISHAYHAACTLLPNLYYLDEHAHTHRPLWNGGLLRIGIFGAPRPQKNVMTGVAGAIQIAQMLKAHTEIWVNAGRLESHGKTILDAAKRAIDRNPYCTYKEFGWAPWPQFRRFINSMNLLVQASYTESFNQVTADGVSQGVPTVVSSAIRWAPEYWQADTDSAESIAQVGRMLIGNPYAQHDGLRALKSHNELGLLSWKKYLRLP